MKMYGLWRDMQFATFGHYCAERLGLSERAVSQRVWLERQMWSFPALRTACSNGRLTYAKALLVARGLANSVGTNDGLGGESSEEAAVIAWAETHTCQELQEELDAQQERQELPGAGCQARECEARVARRGNVRRGKLSWFGSSVCNTAYRSSRFVAGRRRREMSLG